MQTTLRLRTKIWADGKIEISNPQLRSGETVEVIVPGDEGTEFVPDGAGVADGATAPPWRTRLEILRRT